MSLDWRRLESAHSRRRVQGLAARYTGDDLDLPIGDGDELIGGAGRAFNLARAVARAGWSGLEWASNVPGTVGGAVVNNAGAFGSSVAESLIWAEIMGAAGKLERLCVADLNYAYRTSRLKRRELGEWVVVRAAFRVSPSPPAEAVGRIRQYQDRAPAAAAAPRRQRCQSGPGDFAGRLIEAAGLKGVRHGGAEISDQHANFIVNRGRATADDVYALMQLAQNEVSKRGGPWLVPEIELFGRWTTAQRAALSNPTEAR